MRKDLGVPPSGPGHSPKGGAAKASPAKPSVPNAEDFARAAHEGQRYGNRPYAWHLEEVVAVIREAGYGGDYVAAGWLHDVSEDCGVSIATLRQWFGDGVADMVKACTGVGRNRKERNACIYERVAKFPAAAVVKVADRIANVEAAPHESSHAEMYLKEAVGFHENVARLAPEHLQRRLNRAYAAKRAASGMSAFGQDPKGLEAKPASPTREAGDAR